MTQSRPEHLQHAGPLIWWEEVSERTEGDIPREGKFERCHE